MKQNFVNGSDLLLYVGGKAIGHCTSHTITWGTETKDRAFKPAASEAYTEGAQWKEKSIVSKNASISFEGLRFFGEIENGYAELLALMDAGVPIESKGFERKSGASSTGAPYFHGDFVLTQLVETAPAGDDATYSGSLENSGKVTITPSNLTSGPDEE